MDDERVEIIAVSFPGDGLIQVQYMESRDQSPVAAVQRSIMIDTQYLDANELEDFLESARDIVDKGLLLIRSPPEQRRTVAESP